MTSHHPRRGGGTAGGSLLALSIVAGGVIGTIYRQPTIGVLAGFCIGSLLFLLVWLAVRPPKKN